MEEYLLLIMMTDNYMIILSQLPELAQQLSLTASAQALWFTWVGDSGGEQGPY